MTLKFKNKYSSLVKRGDRVLLGQKIADTDAFVSFVFSVIRKADRFSLTIFYLLIFV